MAIKILLGGSPCTHWSIAKGVTRETKAEGVGWELFNNYLIVKEKFQPDIFLYENNKSASQAIKDQIATELGVGTDPNARFTYINSSLVSAQNRQRFYVTNFGDISQPEDRGILLKDILEPGSIGDPRNRDKARTLSAGYQVCSQRDLRMDIETDGFMGKQGAIEPVGATRDGKSCGIKSQYQKNAVSNFITNGKFNATGVAEPICHIIPNEVRVRKYTCDIEEFQLYLRGHKELSKLTNKQIAEALNKPLTEVEHWFRTDKWFNIPDADIWWDLKKLLRIHTTEFDDFVTVFEVRDGVYDKAERCYDVEGKMSTLMTSANDNVIMPIRVGCLPSPDGEVKNSQAMRLYSTEGKSVNLTANAGGLGAKTGLYAIPVEFENGIPTKATSCADGKTYTVYEVKDGYITIKGKQYPIKLVDGYYIIRKLTVTECARLQTMPDNYCKAVSDNQAYKGLGNGWTAEVIIHILSHALKDVPRDEEIIVLSMYDGIGTGRYVLDKMGFTNVKYHAYEIDKYAMAVSMDNYPDIIQHGDAFAVRNEDWRLEKCSAD